MNKFFLLIFSLLFSNLFAQTAEQNLLYIVDSIHILDRPQEQISQLHPEYINNIAVVKDKQMKEQEGYDNVDGILYVFTKAYVQRADSLKQIPSTKNMILNDGKWYLRNHDQAYTGRFIDYYITGQKQGEGYLQQGKVNGKRMMYYKNGGISDIVHYKNAVLNGEEKRFYENGTLLQKGNFTNGVKTGIWEMYHINGVLKQKSNFNTNGNLEGESISFYSTGKQKAKVNYKDGAYQKDQKIDETFALYNEGQELYSQSKFKAAIKKYSEALKIDNNWAEGYFARATAKVNNLDFDEAIEDYNKAIVIEPLYTEAYANRAFASIGKHENNNSRKLSDSKEMTVQLAKNTKLPVASAKKVCSDLNKAIELGDDNLMVFEALEQYCKN
ncbi:tetratricopeptide repeat protein [Weeksellaceae bacterium KMM 9713]|uniref:Tetratricopeptide repeat protein n=1 Tax=Profundicola chukchiensis TaxID=2961959 RepID=A0A9X4RW26_9FLAO|nr:tetratricopeptide repeat protein [Profundicola chukchiensis]MDG4946485.1 tetratricopeptide repeat protein [Profundicola chukchiensis]